MSHTGNSGSGGSEPIKILHVVSALASSGMESAVIQMVNHLDPTRFRSMICCLGQPSEATRSVLDRSIALFVLQEASGSRLRLILRLASLLRSERPHIVHSHSWPTMLYAAVASRLAGVPVLIHGEHEHDDLRIPRRRLLLKRLLARGAFRLVVVSRDLRRELTEDWKVPPERITYIPDGVDLDRFRPRTDTSALRESFGLPRSASIVLSIGDMREIRDNPTLLHAMARIRKRVPDIRLLIAGSDRRGAGSGEMETLAGELGLTDLVLPLGAREDIPELLALCDVYVNSSVFKKGSNTILEAMASGKTVVTTEVGEMPALVQEGVTGFLVPPVDLEAMAERIEGLLVDTTSRIRIGAQARAWVERHHPVSGTTTANAQLYEETWSRWSLRRRATTRERAKRMMARALRWSGAASLRGARQRHSLAILMYHRVLPLPEARGQAFRAMVMPRDVFEGQVAYLARHASVLSFQEAMTRLHLGTLPPRATVLTFDDGYRDNYEHAWPVLQRYGIPATIFLVSRPVSGSGRLWWDDVHEAVRVLCSRQSGPINSIPGLPVWAGSALAAQSRSVSPEMLAEHLVAHLNGEPNTQRRSVVEALLKAAELAPDELPRLLLTWDEVRAMRAEGLEVGAHTATHPFLDELSMAEAHREILECLAEIRARTDDPTRWFSYPRGRVNQGLRQFLKDSGIDAAVTTRLGRNGPGADPYRLARLDAGYANPDAGFDPELFRTLLQGWFTPWRRTVRTA